MYGVGASWFQFYVGNCFLSSLWTFVHDSRRSLQPVKNNKKQANQIYIQPNVPHYFLVLQKMTKLSKKCCKIAQNFKFMTSFLKFCISPALEYTNQFGFPN
jgi:hypothetical protein